MPLLLRGLELPDAQVRTNVIDTLLATAGTGTKGDAISEHAPSLVSVMLRNSMVQEMSSIVRMPFLDRIGEDRHH